MGDTADQARDAMAAATHVYISPPHCDLGECDALAAVLPDGRTVAQHIDHGAAAEEMLSWLDGEAGAVTNYMRSLMDEADLALLDRLKGTP